MGKEIKYLYFTQTGKMTILADSDASCIYHIFRTNTRKVYKDRHKNTR